MFQLMLDKNANNANNNNSTESFDENGGTRLWHSKMEEKVASFKLLTEVF